MKINKQICGDCGHRHQTRKRCFANVNSNGEYGEGLKGLQVPCNCRISRQKLEAKTK